MSSDRYPTETLSEDDDNGTMPDNVAQLASHVIGHRIVKAERQQVENEWYRDPLALVITLDDGRRVEVLDSNDCCAYTDLESFWLDPSAVDHVIIGVGTTDEYTTWHIYADHGDMMRLKVGWSPGNPFYYGYGFNIQVREA